MLTPKAEAEIAGLARRYGTPRRWVREFPVATLRNAEWARKITRRRGEVILAVPRPDGRVLLHTKATYPAGIYRLPGGGINADEPVESAARREAHEEMGFDVELARLAGVIDNVFEVNGEKLRYPSYIFTTKEVSEPPRVMDPDEEITGFNEVPVRDLQHIIEQLNGLPPDWQPWGQFRAAPHALLLEALLKDEG